MQVKNAATDTTSVSSSWLVIRVTNDIPATAHDSTANAHNGAITGATWQTQDQCMSGYCLKFDGVDDNIYVDDARKLDFTASEDFTISLWFKHPTQISGTAVMLSKYESTGADGGYKIYMESEGNITFGIDDDNSSFPAAYVSSTTGDYDDNRWHHVSAIKNGTTGIYLYIDGVLIDSDEAISGIGSLSNNDPLYMGIDGDGTSNPWGGWLDDIKIYPYVRDLEEIQTDLIQKATNRGTSVTIGAKLQAFLNNGLIGHWKMDETSANSCSDGDSDSCDSSGANIHLPWSGDISSTTGKYGYATSLDGTDDRLTLAGASGNDPWYNTSWSKRQPITVTNNTAEELINYQVQINIIYNSYIQNHF